MTHEEQRQMLIDCENRESKLTDWERTFIATLTNGLKARCGASCGGAV